MSTCAVSGTIQDVTETALSGVTIRFKLTIPVFNSTISTYVPKEVTATTTTDGSFTINLARTVSGILSIEYPPNGTDSALRYNYAITIPNTATAILGSLITES
jgi:hypothetical protein